MTEFFKVDDPEHDRAGELADLDAMTDGWTTDGAAETAPWRTFLEYAADSHPARAALVRFAFRRGGFANPDFLADVWPLMTAEPAPDTGRLLRDALCDWLINRPPVGGRERAGDAYRFYLPENSPPHPTPDPRREHPTAVAPALAWLAARFAAEAASRPTPGKDAIAAAIAELTERQGDGGAAALPWRALAALAADPRPNVARRLARAAFSGAQAPNVFIRDAALDLLLALHVHQPATAANVVRDLCAQWRAEGRESEIRLWAAAERRLGDPHRRAWQALFRDEAQDTDGDPTLN